MVTWTEAGNKSASEQVSTHRFVLGQKTDFILEESADPGQMLSCELAGIVCTILVFTVLGFNEYFAPNIGHTLQHYYNISSF